MTGRGSPPPSDPTPMGTRPTPPGSLRFPTGSLPPGQVPGRRASLGHLLALGALLLAILVPHAAWMGGARFLYGHDTVQNHLPRLQILREAYREHGSVPLWTRYLDGGTPFFAIPETPVFYPPVVALTLALPPPPVAALNLSVLLHMLAGGIFAYALAWHVLRHPAGACLAAFYFSSSFFGTWHFLGLPPYGWALAWMPLAVLLLLRILEGRGHLGHAVGLGVVLAAQVHAGGLYIHVYTVLYLAAHAGTHLVLERGRGAGRLAGLAALVAVVYAGLVAVRVLPFLEWMGLTNRAGGLSWEVARTNVLTLGQVIRKYLSWPLLLGLGIPALVSIRSRRELRIPLVLVLLAVAIGSGLLYRVLFEFVPGFRQQRDATRAWTLAHLAVSLLLGAGLAAWWDAAPRLARRGGRAAPWILRGIVLAGVVVAIEHNLSALRGDLDFDQMRQVARIREQSDRFYDRRLVRVEGDAPYRVHALECTFTGDPRTAETLVKRSPQVLTVWHRIESLEAHLGAWWYPELVEDFLQRAAAWPTRAWGILNVKYVTALEPLPRHPEDFPMPAAGLPALRPVPGGGKRSYLAFPDFAMGPQLYRNEDCLPRAYTSRHAVLFAGPRREVREAVLSLLSRPALDLRHVVVLQEEGIAAEEVDARLRARCDAVVDVGSGRMWDREGVVRPYDEEALLRAMTAAGEPIEEGALLARGQNRFLFGVREAMPEGGGLLVVSELFHLFPGWRARAFGPGLPEEGAPLDLCKANGAVTAVLAPEGCTRVSFRYRPDSFVLGARLSAATAGLVLLAALAAGIRRVTRRGSAAP